MLLILLVRMHFSRGNLVTFFHEGNDKLSAKRYCSSAVKWSFFWLTSRFVSYFFHRLQVLEAFEGNVVEVKGVKLEASVIEGEEEEQLIAKSLADLSKRRAMMANKKRNKGKAILILHWDARWFFWKAPREGILRLFKG